MQRLSGSKKIENLFMIAETIHSLRGVMKTIKIILLLALLILLIGHASGQVTLEVDVPPGWELQESYEEDDWGYWEYGTDFSFITIYYDTNVPEELVGHEDDPDALIAYAYDYAFFTPDESGIDIVDGRTAGYAHSTTEYGYEHYIIYVKEDIFVDIYCDISYEDYDSATALINSISISTPTPSPELVAYYPFDGDARDYSGNGNDGTNHGATFVSGISGQALRFDGTDDYVSAPVNINPDVMPQMTMAAWVRADDDSGMTLISHDNGGFDRTIDIDYRGGGWGWSAFSGSGGVLGYYPVTIGQWVFIAAVYDQEASTVKLYVNDALYEETGSLASGWDYVNIGKNPSFGAYFYGTIDEVRIYNYALSAAEIQALYESVSIPSTPTPTPTPSHSPSPIPTTGEVGILSPATLEATLNSSESVTELKTYTTAEGKPITRVDVLFDFDLTASMGGELSTMQTESQNIMNSLLEQCLIAPLAWQALWTIPGGSPSGITATHTGVRVIIRGRWTEG
jgi:hypothetical protein